MAALWASLLEVFARCSPPFPVCWICWVEVRGSQCHVSENISWLHSLSLLVCLEIGSARRAPRGRGGEGPGRSYSKLHFPWNNMHDRILIMKGASTALAQKRIQTSKFLLHQQTLQPKGKRSETTHTVPTPVCRLLFSNWASIDFMMASVKTCQLAILWETHVCFYMQVKREGSL